MSAPDGCGRCQNGEALAYYEGMPDAEITVYVATRCGPCLRTLAAQNGYRAQALTDVLGPMNQTIANALGFLGVEAAGQETEDANSAWERECAAILAVTTRKLGEAFEHSVAAHRRIAELAGEELRRREAGA